MSASAWESALKMTNGNEADAEKFLADNGVNASAKRVLTLREKSAKKVFGTLGQDRMSSLRKRMSSVHEQKRGNMTQLFLNSLNIYDFEDAIADDTNIAIKEARVRYYKENLMAIDIMYDLQGWDESQIYNLIAFFYESFLKRIQRGYVMDLFVEQLQGTTGEKFRLRRKKLLARGDLNLSLRDHLRATLPDGETLVLGFVVREDDQSETRVIIDLDTRIKDILRITTALHKNEDSTAPKRPFRMLRLDSHSHGLARGKTLVDVIDPNGALLSYDDQAVSVVYGISTPELNESDEYQWVINGINGMIINPVPGVDLSERVYESGLESHDYIQKMVALSVSYRAEMIRSFYKTPVTWLDFEDVTGLAQRLADDPSLMSIKLEDVASPVTDPSKLIQTL